MSLVSGSRIVDTLDKAVKELFDNNEIQDDILGLGNEANYMAPADYESLFEKTEQEYTELLK